jgi:hypothetical protein
MKRATTKKAPAKLPTAPAKQKPEITRVNWDTGTGGIIATTRMGEHAVAIPVSLENLSQMIEALPWGIVSRAEALDAFEEVADALKEEIQIREAFQKK